MNVPDYSAASGIFTPEMLWERGLEEAARAYEKLRGIEGITPANAHTGLVCEQWSRAAAQLVAAEVRLFDPSARVQIQEWKRAPQDVTTPHMHRFISVQLAGLEPRIMDGTWQQFLSPDLQTPDVPKMLSGTIVEVTQAAGKAGIRSQLLSIWGLASSVRY